MSLTLIASYGSTLPSFLKARVSAGHGRFHIWFLNCQDERKDGLVCAAILQHFFLWKSPVTTAGRTSVYSPSPQTESPFKWEVGKHRRSSDETRRQFQNWSPIRRRLGSELNKSTKERSRVGFRGQCTLPGPTNTQGRKLGRGCGNSSCQRVTEREKSTFSPTSDVQISP